MVRSPSTICSSPYEPPLRSRLLDHFLLSDLNVRFQSCLAGACFRRAARAVGLLREAPWSAAARHRLAVSIVIPTTMRTKAIPFVGSPALTLKPRRRQAAALQGAFGTVIGDRRGQGGHEDSSYVEGAKDGVLKALKLIAHIDNAMKTAAF